MTKSYIERDIVALRKKMIDYVKNEASSWSDFNESDLGIIFVEVLAGCVDMCNYYLDKQANEVFLDRAEEPKNIRSILNTMNYRIPLKASATGTLNIMLVEGNPIDIVIPKYTVFSTTTDPVMQYCSTEEKTIVAGVKEIALPVMQGKRYEVKETVAELSRDYKYRLSINDIADKSVRVIDSKGEWTEVDDAYLKYEGGRYFSVHKDVDDTIYILFTWDWVSQLPDDQDEQVTILFLETLGTKGSTPPYTINYLQDRLYDLRGNDVTNLFMVKNIESISGGQDEPEVYKMITDAKNNIKMMGKLVTLEDYANAVNAYRGVFKSITQDWSVPNTYVKKAYKVETWVVSEDGSTFSQDFLSSLAVDLTDRGIAIVEVEAHQADFNVFDVVAEIKVNSSSTEYRDKVRLDAIVSVQKALSYDSMEFGKAIYLEDIRYAIKSVSNAITEITIKSPTDVVFTEDVAYPKLGKVDITVVGDIYGA